MSDVEFLHHCFGFTKRRHLRGTLTVDAISIDPVVKLDENLKWHGLIKDPKTTVNTPDELKQYIS